MKSDQTTSGFVLVRSLSELPKGVSRRGVASFLHETMKPYEDKLEDIESALDYAFTPGCGAGGFLVLAHNESEIECCLLMLNTGMGGYVPANILLFVSVAPELRGRGVGEKLIGYALQQCSGDVKLHVEYDNPARRLYERIGFESNYAEMRLKRK